MNLSDDSDDAEDGDEQPSEIIAKMKQMFPDLNLDSSSEEDEMDPEKAKEHGDYGRKNKSNQEDDID